MFIAYEVSLEAIRSLRPVLPAIAARDAGLAAQLREAAASVPLNLAEGRRRRGRDRTHHYRIGAGSAGESLAALDVADAFGYADEALLAEPRRLYDRVLRLLWPLTK